MAQVPQVVEVTGQRPPATPPPPPRSQDREPVDWTLARLGELPAFPDAVFNRATPRAYSAVNPAGTGAAAPAPACSGGGVPSVQPRTANPVILSSGAKYLEEVDLRHFSGLSLGLTRAYRSDVSDSDGMFGSNWRSGTEYELTRVGDNGLVFRRPDGSTTNLYLWVPPGGGQYYYFTYAAFAGGGQYPGHSAVWANYYPSTNTMDVGSTATGLTYRFTLKNYNGTQKWTLDTIWERYNRGGGGAKYTYGRDASGRIVSITNAYGASVQFVWGDGRHVTSVIAPGGAVWSYSYNSDGMLYQVTPPASTPGVYTYLYEDPSNRTRLTGYAVDGVRKSEYAYDGSGRVTSSRRLDGSVSDTFAYGASSTTKTDINGRQTTYSFTTLFSQKLLAGTQTSGMASCPNAAVSQTYDSNGALASSVDANGTETRYSFDQEGRVLSKTVAPNTAVAMTTTYAYSVQGIQRETVIGADGRGVRQTDYTYTSSILGELPLSKTVTDLLSGSVPLKEEFAYTFYPNGGIQTRTANMAVPGGGRPRPTTTTQWATSPASRIRPARPFRTATTTAWACPVGLAMRTA